MRAPIKITTTKLQGPDTWVSITSITWAERKANDAALDAARVAGEEWDFIAAREELIRRHLVDWNWTDAAGVELPKPSKATPEEFRAVLDDMPSTEIDFLYNAITSATPEKLKN